MTAIKDKVGSFKDGLIHGVGWAFGVTLGFILVSALIWFIVNRLGGIPFVANQLAPLLESASESTYTRTPTIPE